MTIKQQHKTLILFLDKLCNCVRGGADSNTLEVLLSLSAIWLTIIRPFVFFLWTPEQLFVDVGSHLVLTIISVFSPILPLKHRQVKNVYQIEMPTPVTNHLINSYSPAGLTDEN